MHRRRRRRPCGHRGVRLVVRDHLDARLVPQHQSRPSPRFALARGCISLPMANDSPKPKRPKPQAAERGADRAARAERHVRPAAGAARYFALDSARPNAGDHRRKRLRQNGAAQTHHRFAVSNERPRGLRRPANRSIAIRNLTKYTQKKKKKRIAIAGSFACVDTPRLPARRCRGSLTGRTAIPALPP